MPVESKLVDTMNESAKTRKLCSELSKLGFDYYATAGNQFSQPGWPDRYIAGKRFIGWIEFKEKSGRISDAQCTVGTRLTKRGVLCFVFWYDLNWFTDFNKNVMYQIPKLTAEEFAKGLECLAKTHGSS